MSLFHLLWKVVGGKSCSLRGAWEFWQEGKDEPLRIEVWNTHSVKPSGQINDAIMHAGFSKPVHLGILDYLDDKGIKDINTDGFSEHIDVVTCQTMVASSVSASVFQIVIAKNLVRQVFLVGSSTQIGKAVGLYLANKEFNVVCCGLSEDELNAWRLELPENHQYHLMAADNLVAGSNIRTWIIGEIIPNICDHIPKGAEAVIFSDKSPIDERTRPDIYVTFGTIFKAPADSYRKAGSNEYEHFVNASASQVGLVVHACHGWECRKSGEMSWTRIDEHLAAAYRLGFRLPPLGADLIHRRVPGWFSKFGHLLKRNARSYYRNYANVGARVAMNVTIATLMGLIYFGLGTRHNEVMNNVFGALFFSMTVLSLLPISSLSTFLYDRQFFQSEESSGMYPSSAYYLANIVLEVIFNTINGVIFAVITYYMMDFNAFVKGPELKMAAGYTGICVVMNLLANAMTMCLANISPNLEIGFVLSAGFVAICSLAAGMIVTIPNMAPSMRWLNLISMIKYPYQALLLLFFKDNHNTVTPFGGYVEDIIGYFELDHPDTVMENILVAFCYYIIFIVGGFIFLKYLHKERR